MCYMLLYVLYYTAQPKKVLKNSLFGFIGKILRGYDNYCSDYYVSSILFFLTLIDEVCILSFFKQP